MTIGFVIVCDEAAGSLDRLQGRSVLGLTLDRVRRALGALPVTIADPHGSDALRTHCTRALLTYHHGTAPDAIRQAGWDAAICLEADQIFVDHSALHAALSLMRSGRFGMVTTHGNAAHPKGSGVTALRADALDQTAPAHHADGPIAALVAACAGADCYVLPCESSTPAPDLDLRARSDAPRIGNLLDFAGADPAGVPLDLIIGAAQRGQETTPWQGQSGPLLIAEIGGNHEGNFDVAKAMAASALRSGADCVKFQLYTGQTLVSPVESPTRHKHFQKFELAREQHIYLAEMCREAGVSYVSSVWDEEMLEWIDPYMDFYKIGSGDLTAWPFLRKIAARGKPILLSTGLADMDDVLQTVAQIQDVDARFTRPEWMCVMQCTSMYPIPDTDAHLRVMDRLRAATGLAIGYSDHTIGMDALHAATAMGAEVLEFHFTDSREGKEFRDHKVSLVEQEVQTLKTELEQIRDLRGTPVKVPQASELVEGHEVSFRRATYLNRDAKAGEVIGEDDLVYLRPAHGTDARDGVGLIGRKLRADVQAFAALEPGTHY